jgi:transcription initiation factor TFIIB
MATGLEKDAWDAFDCALIERSASLSTKEIAKETSSRKSENICVNCNIAISDEYISDGFLVCNRCGLVLDTYIEATAEWRCFNNNGARSVSGIRCGDVANSLLPGTQLNTFIGGSDKRLQRVHQWNNITAKERNLHQIFKEFETTGQAFNLQRNIVQLSAELYSQLYTEMEKKNCGVKRCNVRQGLKSACLYFSCKQLGFPRERKEIADMLGTTTKIVTKGCNSFLDIMGGDYVKLPPFRPEDFVARFSQLLSIPFQYQCILKRIVEFAGSLEVLADNTPTSITSACIYYLSLQHPHLNISKGDIHEKLKSSGTIVMKTYTKMLPYLHGGIPP